jgi:hypothetical protein
VLDTYRAEILDEALRLYATRGPMPLHRRWAREDPAATWAACEQRIAALTTYFRTGDEADRRAAWEQLMSLSFESGQLSAAPADARVPLAFGPPRSPVPIPSSSSAASRLRKPPFRSSSPAMPPA